MGDESPDFARLQSFDKMSMTNQKERCDCVAEGVQVSTLSDETPTRIFCEDVWLCPFRLQ